LLSTPLLHKDVSGRRDLIDELFRTVPTGVGAKSSLKVSLQSLDGMMMKGARWAVSEGYGVERDLVRCEEGGYMKTADSRFVSAKAKQRGIPQGGTLGSGNHFLEIQVVSEIFDETLAEKLGLQINQIVVLMHSGSRGLGHQVCTDYLDLMQEGMKRYGIKVIDRQLACVPIRSREGQDYLAAMAAAANFAFANRQMITHWTRQAFERILGKSDLYVVYDVCHNIAKREEHQIGTVRKEVLVHRKGATRAFPPGHSALPLELRPLGQPVLIPGSMGTCSYVLVGTEQAMAETFGSCCHGAGRAKSRTQAKRETSATN
jgi:tRNA-splicing ligase RtcB